MLYAIDVFKNSNHLFSFRWEVELNERRERGRKRERERGGEASFCQYSTPLHSLSQCSHAPELWPLSGRGKCSLGYQKILYQLKMIYSMEWRQNDHVGWNRATISPVVPTWVWNLVSRYKETTRIDGVRTHSAAGILTYGIWSNWKAAKSK